MRRFILGCMVLSAVFGAHGAPAAITFNFNYTDPSGMGFNDPALGAARRNALQQAADAFAQSLSSYSATIVLNAEGTATGSTLAFAGSDYVSDSFSGGGFGRYEVIRNKILNATDLNGSFADGIIGVNFSQPWELGPAPGDVGSAEFDWYSTMYHEFTHAIGFSHGIVDQGIASGQDGFGSGAFGSGLPGEWTKFDEFLSDSGSNRIISGTSFESTMAQSAWDALVVGGPSPTGGLFFDGLNAKAANGGNPVGLYTPTTYEGGSSIAHTDDENTALAGTLMLASVGGGLNARTFTGIEQGILKDLGYTTIGQIGVAIPEPSAFWLVGAVLFLRLVCTRRLKALLMAMFRGK